MFLYTVSPVAPKSVARVGVPGETGPGREETGANMRSRWGPVSPETRGARERRQRWGRADTFRDASYK